MICRTSPLKSAWNFGINMFLDSGPATANMTENGANSKSSSGPQKDCLLLMSTRNPVTWRRAAKLAAIFLVFICGVMQFPAAGLARRQKLHPPAPKAAAPSSPQQPQQKQPQQKDEPYRITRDVN